MHEQVVHGFDVFAEESHCTDPFVMGRNGALFAPHTPKCPIADTSANQGSAGLFLDFSKTPQWNARTSPMMGTSRGGSGRDSNLPRQDIYVYVRRVTAAAVKGRGC
jgi:hypothetical protein